MTPSLLPGRTHGGLTGARYQFVDLDTVPDQTYTYWLDDVDVWGRATRHGPVWTKP